MQLVLLSTVNQNDKQALPFLSSAHSYLYDNGRFIPKNETLAKLTSFDIPFSFEVDDLHGSIFNRCSIVTNPHVNENLMILYGLSQSTGKEVYVCFCDNNFQNFSDDDAEGKYLILENYVCGGIIDGQEFKDILLSSIKKVHFTKSSPEGTLSNELVFKVSDVENNSTTNFNVKTDDIKFNMLFFRSVVAVQINPFYKSRYASHMYLCNASLFEYDENGTLVTKDQAIKNTIIRSTHSSTDTKPLNIIFNKIIRISSTDYKTEIIILKGQTLNNSTRFLVGAIDKQTLKKFIKDQDRNPVIMLPNTIWYGHDVEEQVNKIVTKLLDEIMSHLMCAFIPVKIGPVLRYTLFKFHNEKDESLRNPIYYSTGKIAHTSNFNSHIYYPNVSSPVTDCQYYFP